MHSRLFSKINTPQFFVLNAAIRLESRQDIKMEVFPFLKHHIETLKFDPSSLQTFFANSLKTLLLEKNLPFKTLVAFLQVCGFLMYRQNGIRKYISIKMATENYEKSMMHFNVGECTLQLPCTFPKSLMELSNGLTEIDKFEIALSDLFRELCPVDLTENFIDLEKAKILGAEKFALVKGSDALLNHSSDLLKRIDFFIR